jgi:hypothetical protein
MKLAYQGKKEIKQLPEITLKTIGRREKRLPH